MRSHKKTSQIGNESYRSLAYIKCVLGPRASNSRHTPQHARVPRVRTRARSARALLASGPPRLREGDRCHQLQPGAQAPGLRSQPGVPGRTEEQSEAGNQAEAGRACGRGQCDTAVERGDDREADEEARGEHGRRGAGAPAARVQPGEREGAGAVPVPPGAAVQPLPPLGLVAGRRAARAKCQGCADATVIPPRLERISRASACAAHCIMLRYLSQVAVIERSNYAVTFTV